MMSSHTAPVHWMANQDMGSAGKPRASDALKEPLLGGTVARNDDEEAGKQGEMEEGGVNVDGEAGTCYIDWRKE